MLKHTKMVEDDAQDVLVRFQLGKLYHDLYRYEHALEQFLIARELGFDRASTDKWIGYSYSGLGRYTESRKIFESLREQLPKDDNIQKWFVYVTAREEQAKEGATAESYIKTGNIKYREESYDSAISEYKRALEYTERALKIYRKIGARRGELWALLRSGWCYASLFRH